MPERILENSFVSKMAAKKISAFISLWFVAIFFLACGGSDGAGAGEGSGTAIFPPVVFLADTNLLGTVELYASSDDGTDIKKLSGEMVDGGDVVDFKVSPDGIWVAYVADQEDNEKFELYVVPVDKTAGESEKKISGTPMAGRGIKEKATGRYAFEWAPDSSRVAYLADQNTADVIELYSNLPDGGDLVRLSVLPEPDRIDRDVEDFAWSPNLENSRLIAYRADQQTVNVIELYTTSPGSEASQKINTGLGPGRNLTAFKWAPNAGQIGFIADKTAGIFELYTTLPTTTVDTHVSGGLAVTSDVLNFKWSPDSAQLAYLVQTGTIPPDPPDFKLLTTPNASLASISITRDIEDSAESNYGWSWDSSLVAFIADENTPGVFELYTSDPDFGSTNTKVSGLLLPPGGDVTAFKWAPTILLIAYTADQNINNKIELFTTNPPPAVTDIKVSRGAHTELVVEDDFQWSPDSTLIAYRANQNNQNIIELYSTDPEGLENNKVSGTLPSGGEVDEFKWDDQEAVIGYLANQISVFVTELFASLSDGDENTRLSSDLVDGDGDPEADDEVSAFEWVP